jgi:hypothetical protein
VFPPKRGFDPIYRTHTASSLGMKRHSSRFIKIHVRHVLFLDADLYIDKRIAILLWVSYRTTTTGFPVGHLVVMYNNNNNNNNNNTYLLQLSFHSVAVVLTLVQTKQIRMNIHKRNNTKIQYRQYRTQ